MVELTKKEYKIIAKNRGIEEPQKMSTQELLDTLSRYDSRRKVKNTRKNLLNNRTRKIAKIPNISKNELNQVKKVQRKPIDELKRIARLRRIKNSEKITKEELIIVLLKSGKSTLENNFIKHFNNNTDDDTYDDKIRGKISDINIIFSRIGNIVTNKDRKKIKREIYKMEKKENLSDKEKEVIYNHLVELVNTLNKKKTYQYNDRDDINYYGISDIENLFSNIDDYYKPILVKSSFKTNYKYFESRGDKNKKMAVKQYLYKIVPYLRDKINNHKAIRNESKEWKIQINMHANSISSKDTGETRIIYVWIENEEINLGNETDDMIKELFNFF